MRDITGAHIAGANAESTARCAASRFGTGAGGAVNREGDRSMIDPDTRYPWAESLADDDEDRLFFKGCVAALGITAIAAVVVGVFVAVVW